MANICKTVNLYTRKIKGGKMLSYFLDYYPGYRDETTNRVLRHESLGIYIYAHPRTQREKEYNARLSEKAEALRCRRYEEIVNERYEFFDKNKLNGSFIDYFKSYAGKKNSRYEQAYQHFNLFTGGKCTFAEITVELCNKFLEYLRTTHQVIHTRRKLHPNTIASYWSAFLGTLHAAHFIGRYALLIWNVRRAYRPIKWDCRQKSLYNWQGHRVRFLSSKRLSCSPALLVCGRAMSRTSHGR